MGNLTVHIDPPDEVITPITEGLQRFNEEHVGSVKPLVLVISATDAAGEVIGGVKGLVLWGWLYVEKLWVNEEQRGRGLGGELLERLESEAIAKGAKRSVLLSTSWQAPAFYRRYGYDTIASFDLDIPSGPRRGHEVDYLFVKPLEVK
jgi:ribosomal protein S18 acetylase RimI-like enzyme